MIVIGELISINDRKRQRIVCFVSQDLEDKFFIENGVEVVPNDSCSVCFLAKRRHDKGIHVESGSHRCRVSDCR